MSIVLKTNTSAYLLDPSNEDLVLKRNGKWSSVYLGYRLEDKLPVVIKVLKNPDDIQTQFRFQREALMGFNFNGVQHTIDAWRDDTGYYIIKEFVQGLTLRQLMQHDIKSRELFAAKCMVEALEILYPIHQSGVIHCDLRPDNIVVLTNKRGHPDINNPKIVLLDFGLSCQTDALNTSQRLPFSLIYSPPEQLLNFPQLINATTDLYSLGLTMYEWICKYPPFFNENPEMVMHLQLNTAVEEHKAIRPALLQVIRRATFKKPLRLPPAQLELYEMEQTIAEGQQLRYPSCVEFKTAIEDLLTELSKPVQQNFFSKIFK